jgi:hypothetical protein
MGLSVMATPVPLDLLPPQFRKREEQEQPSNAVPLDLLPSDLKPQPEEQPSNVVPLDLLPSQLRSREVEPTTRPTTRPTARELPIPSAEPEESSFIRQVLDVPLGVAKGAATGFRMIADAFGAGSGVSEAIKSSEKYLEGLMSAQSRNDSAEISRIMQDAEDKGFGDQVRAAIQAFTIAPIDLVSQALGTSAPMLLGGVATAVLRGGATAASKVAAATAASRVATGLGGAQGAGLIKGNIYDAVKEEMLKAGDSPALAEEKAQQAQAYGGKNLDQILLGTALGAFAGRTGVEKLILNKIAGKEAAEQSLLRRTGEGAVTEAAPEFVQAAQEAAATNIALQREGFDVPTMRGVVGQATLEGLAGSALGATTGALSKPRVAADTAEDKAIAALDKLAADEEAEELKLEESILARADEIVEEFIGAGQTISMDDAYERARFELVEDKSQAATSGLVGEEDLFAEEAAAAIPPQETIPTTTAAAIPPQETIPATPEELKKIDKDLRKKLGRAPIFEETEAALNDFEQEKTRRLRAESGGRGPTVPVLSGEEAVSGVTRAPERVEPTGLGRAVEPTDVSGARKEPTLGAIEPKDQINTAKEMMADISKQPLNVENVSGKIIGGVKSYKGFKFYKVQEGSETFWKVQSPENQALNRIGNGDTSHGNSALAKDMIGENLDNKFDAETFARRLLPKLTEGKATPAETTAPALPQAKPDEPSMPIQRGSVSAIPMSLLTTPEALQRVEDVLKVVDRSDPKSVSRALDMAAERGGLAEWEARAIAFGPEGQTPTQTVKKRRAVDLAGGFRTVEDLSPEDKAAFDSETAEIRASMKEATNAAKERGLPFANAAAPFVDQLRALDQSYGIGEPISEGDIGVRPATDEDISMYNVDATPQMTEAEISQGVTDVREEQIAEYARLRAKKGRLVQKVIGGSNTIDTQRELTNLDNVTKALKEAIDVEYTPSTSPARFLSRALEAFDKGDISAEVLATIQEAYNKTPFILNGLRLSIRTPKDDTREIGNFNPLERIVTLWNGTRGVENPSTVRHELMHSLEQMMTKGAKEAIINAWYKAFQKGIKKYKDPKSQEFFHKVLDFLDKPNNESLDVAIKALPSYDFYQYINPSEFWAVNAEKLFAAKLGSGWERFKSAVRKLFEALKDTFGFDNNYAVHKTFDSLIKGKAPRGGSDITNYLLSGKKVNFLSNVENLDTELEQKVIELSLKVGDIHPTMVSAIANNDLNGALLIASQKLSGFSAELAKKLLDLKLPTNISFNNGRDLVRRSIDDMSAPQQQRLFRYVGMHYPQVYDKYFKNYDRSESLETVAEGLIELQKPNYKLGPVIAEFDTVSGAYKEHIKGLTSPGAYYPRYDEIVLNTNTLSGKSYRVFLHEVVHAATEYALNTYGTNPQSLTPGQRESVEELTKMYNYALKEIGSAPYGMTNIYEFISEVFTNKKFQELLKGIKYKSDKPTFLSKLIKAIFKAVGFDNLASNAMVEATNIFSAVRSQTTVDRGPRFAKSGPKTARVKGPISSTWRSVEDVTKSLIQVFNDGLKGRSDWESVLKDIKDSMWDTSTGTYRRAILGFANLRQIDDLTKTKFPQISAAIRMIEQMLAYRGNIMKTAEDITKKWTKAKIKNLKQDILMSRIMIEATIRGIDPDRPGVKPVNAALVQAWNQLEPEFKEIYREVRDFYKTSVENMIREMRLRIAKSTMTLTEKKKALREIKDKFGPDKLVQPYFPLRRFGTYWFQVGGGKGKGNFKEFYEFEDQFTRDLSMRRRIRDLSKGNAQQQALVGTVKKGSGVSDLFSQNRTVPGIIKDVQAIVDSVGGTQAKPTQAQYNITEKLLKKQLGRTPTVDEVEKRFEQEKIKQELKDSLNQMLYILLPQQSMRKMFINRKAIQGASSDMLRVFATSAVHSAYQQSRFKYAESFLNNLTTAIDYVQEFTDRDRAAMYREYISEVEKRAKTILSNEDTSLAARAAGRASELTFFYMLSAPFSAMLNVLGVAQVTMPYIGGRYGYAKTNALMIKNFGRYFATMPSRTIAPLATGSIMQAQFPSIVEGGKLTGVLKRAADRFIEEGQINISLTNDLMDMGERPSELYTGRYNIVKKMLSGLFHQSERLGREVSLLTTFELAYDKLSKSPKKDLRGVIERDAQGNPVMNTPEEAFELAISEAKDIVGLSLGDFTRQMKPRYFTPPLLSVITKFKQYSVLATYAVVRNFYFTVAAPFRKAEIEEFRQQMIKDKMSPKVIEQRLAEAEAQRKELYQEGRRRLAGILGITYLLGGNEASPFYSIGIGTLVKMLANEDDDEFFDWENWLKNYMEEELGGAAGDMFAEMGMDPKTADKAGRFVGSSLQRGVVSEITGGDLATRVSLDPKSLWYREGRYSPDVRESIVEDVIANAGPVVGLGFNWIDSYRLFQEGQYQRAFEKAAPALVSKPVAAERIADEGARTASGIKLADNFSAWELSMLSIGLQPTRLAQAQKSAIEAKQYAEKVKDRRATLLNRLWMERDNVEGFNETLERIIEFNNKYPGQHISPDNAMESFERRAENQAIAETIGGQFDKKSIPEALQMLRYGRE